MQDLINEEEFAQKTPYASWKNFWPYYFLLFFLSMLNYMYVVGNAKIILTIVLPIVFAILIRLSNAKAGKFITVSTVVLSLMFLITAFFLGNIVGYLNYFYSYALLNEIGEIALRMVSGYFVLLVGGLIIMTPIIAIRNKWFVYRRK